MRLDQGLESSDLLVNFGTAGLGPRRLLPVEGVRYATPDEVHPALAAIIQPWVERARKLLRSRVTSEHYFFAGSPLPLRALEGQFTQRLTALLTQAFAATDGNFFALAALDPLLRRATNDYVSATATFLDRLRCDQAMLFGSRRRCPIRSITGTDSDPHGGGHVVLKFVFADGSVFYYKPRPVTGEWLWSTLLQLVGACNASLAMPCSLILARGSRWQYGWAQAIPGALDGGPLSSTYWQRSGALLCLAQHMRMTDLHLGNVLQTNDGPAVTDAECLATPYRGPEPGAFTDARKTLLATGLLPAAIVPGRTDVSGLFGRGGQVESLSLPGWAISRNGSWRFEPRDAEFTPPRAPGLGATPISVLPQLVEGYREAAATLIALREQLLRPCSTWRHVLEQDHAPRIVIRETLTYSRWISRSLAPVHLRSAAGRRRAIMATLRNESPPPSVPAILRAEAQALLAAEIPRFVIPAGTRTLASNLRHPVTSRFTACTPAQSVLSSLASLSPRSLDEVLVPALMHAALASRY